MKIRYLWNSLRPAVQRLVKWSIAAFLLASIAWYCLGCASVPQVVNTTKTQEDGRRAQNEFRNFPSSGSTLTPEDQAIVDHVRGALNLCLVDLKKTTDGANKCEAAKAKLQRDFETLQKDRDEWREKFQSESGFWARVKRTADSVGTFFSILRWVFLACSLFYVFGWLVPPSRLIDLISVLLKR